MKSDQPKPPHIQSSLLLLQIVVILTCLYFILTVSSPMILVGVGLVMATLILIVMNELGLYLHPHKRFIHVNH